MKIWNVNTKEFTTLILLLPTVIYFTKITHESHMELPQTYFNAAKRRFYRKEKKGNIYYTLKLSLLALILPLPYHDCFPITQPRRLLGMPGTGNWKLEPTHANERKPKTSLKLRRLFICLTKNNIGCLLQRLCIHLTNKIICLTCISLAPSLCHPKR